MRKNKFLYRISALSAPLFLLLFIAFSIMALVLREQGKPFLVWFLLAGISVLLAVIGLFVYLKILQTEWYKEIAKSTRSEKFQKARKKKFKEYILEAEPEQLLGHFRSACFHNGKIFFREGINIYNRKKTSVDIFFLPKEPLPSLDSEAEQDRLKSLSEGIDAFLTERKLDTSFINCVILFQHNEMEEKEKDFYYNFTGVWESQTENGKIVKNRFFTYCGIEQSGKHVAFYKPLPSDEGTEVDLSYLILRELKLKEKTVL